MAGAAAGPVPAASATAGVRRADTSWLDLARVLAIAAVVVIHVLAPVVETKTTDFGTGSWWVANVGNSAMRWCVPAFVMVSGALLLDPRKADGVKAFYRRRLRRVGIPLVAWTGFYLAFRSVYFGDVTAESAAQDVLAGSPFLQLYFLFVIVGLYLITPFLRVLVRAATRRMLWAFALVMAGLGALDQVISVIGGTGNPNAVTRFLPFIGYFVAGWLLRDVRLTPRVLEGAALAFLGSWIVTALGTGAVTEAVGWGRYAAYLYGFLSPPVVVMSVSAFLLIRWAGTRWTPGPVTAGWLGRLSDLTFGVFLVHAAILFPLRRALPIPADLVGMLAVTAVLTTVVVTASLAITALLRAVPLLRATV